MSSNTCSCACCGEITSLYGDCFCDRIEKNKLTRQDKEWLKKHPDYLKSREKMLDIPDDLDLEV